MVSNEFRPFRMLLGAHIKAASVFLQVEQPETGIGLCFVILT
jgi:hypothetical protein